MKKISNLFLFFAFALMSLSAFSQTVPLGTAADYVWLSGGSINATDTITGTGKMGAVTSISTSVYNDDSIFTGSDPSLIQALNDMDTAIAYADSLIPYATSISGTLSGSLSPGTYSITGNAILSGATLSLSGDTSSIYIFIVSDSLIAGYAGILNIGSVEPCHIFWRANNVVLSDSCLLQGIILASGNITSGKYNKGRRTMMSAGNISLQFSWNGPVMNYTNYSYNRMKSLFSGILPWTNDFCENNPSGNPAGNPGLFFFSGNTGTVNNPIFGIASVPNIPNISPTYSNVCIGCITFSSCPTCCGSPTKMNVDMMAANHVNGYIFFVEEYPCGAQGVQLFAMGSNSVMTPPILTMPNNAGNATVDNFGNYWYIDASGNLGFLNYNPNAPYYTDTFVNRGIPLGVGKGASDLVFNPIDCNFYALNLHTIYQFYASAPLNISANSTSDSNTVSFGSEIVLGLNYNLYEIYDGTGMIKELSLDPMAGAWTAISPDTNNNVLPPTNNNSDAASFICYNPVTNITYVQDTGCSSADYRTVVITNNSTVNGFSVGDTSAYFDWNKITYSWNYGGGTLVSSSGNTVTVIFPDTGTYSVTLCVSGCPTSGNLCDTISIKIYGPMTAINMITPVNENCHGDSTGIVGVSSVTGGMPLYSYVWTPSGGTNATASGLAAGTYTVTVTDAHGCTRTATTTITQPAQLHDSLTIRPIRCSGGTIDSVWTFVTGGTPGYTYLWLPGGMTTNTVTNLASGSYSVRVTDSHGCSITSTFTITMPTPLLVSITPGNIINDSCHGSNNGRVILTVSGGTPFTTFPPYHYSWSNGQTADTAFGLGAGTYYVTVTDANGCTAVDSVTITQPTAVVANAYELSQSCALGNTGRDSVHASGGTAPYTYLWSSGQNTQTCTGLAPGTYTVTVTDLHGCTAVDTVTITSIVIYVHVKNHKKCDPSPPTIAWVDSIHGGTGPYTYNWNTIPPQNTDTAIIYNTGTYTVTVTDLSTGCTGTASTTISMDVIPLPLINGVQYGCEDTATYSITPLAGYIYIWSVIHGTPTTATGTSVTVSWNIPPDSLGEVTVGIDDTANNCIHYANLIVYPCCGEHTVAGSQIFNNIDLVQLYDTAASTHYLSDTAGVIYLYTGNTCYINGLFIVDNDFTIYNCPYIKLGPYAKILIEPGYTMTITGNNSSGSKTVLSACGDVMWDGIYISDSTASLIINSSGTADTTKYTTIMEAENAVVSQYGGYYDITQALFDQNYKDMIVKNCANYNFAGSVVATHFTNLEGPLLIPYATRTRGNTGIEIINMDSITIGGFSAMANDENFFFNKDVGINSLNSSIVAENNSFKSITRISTSIVPLSGYAIYSNGNTNTAFYRSLKSYKDTMKNCTEGVHVINNVALNVTRNYMTNFVSTIATPWIDGVYDYFSHKRNVIIDSNNISNNFNYGIYCNTIVNSLNGTKTLINYDTVRNGTTGIEADILIFGNGYLSNLYVNHDSVTDCRIGIAIGNDNGGTIDTNRISFSSGSFSSANSYWGIRNSNSGHYDTIHYNKVKYLGANPDSTKRDYGITSEGCFNSYISNNHIINMGKGIYTSSTNPGTYLRCNYMDNCDTGVFMNLSSLPPQGSLTDASDNRWSGISHNATFRRDVIRSGCCPPFWFTQAAAPNIFGPWAFPGMISLTTTATSTGLCGIPPYPLSPYDFREGNLKSIIDNSQQYDSTYFADEQYQAICYAYRTILNDTSIISLGYADDTLFQNFYDSVSATNIGSFVEVENYLDAGNLASAPFVNDAIVPTNTEETNLQIVYDVYIHTWAVDTFDLDSTQTALLDSIAYQSPVTGGDAVLKARVMLGLIIDDFDDDGDTDGDRIRRNIQTSDTLINSFNLYPNPNDGTMELDYNLEENKSCSLEIYSITGQPISKFNLRQGQNTLKINETKLSNGIYFYCIFVNDRIVKRDKLVILK